MGWFKKRSTPVRSRDSGLPWNLRPADTFTYNADVRIEDTERYTPDCHDIIHGDDYRGFATDHGNRPLPWHSGNVLDLEVDANHRCAVFSVGTSPGSQPVIPQGGPAYSAVPGMRQLQVRGNSICGFSLSPDGKRVAVVEWHQWFGALTIVDLATGTRRFITRLDGVGGNEIPSWSPDGDWVIVPSSPTQIVGLREGVLLPFNLGENPYLTKVDWWPARGPSSLFALHGEPLNQRVSAVDLASGEVTAVTPVRVIRQEGLDDRRHGVWQPRMSPTGDQVLVSSMLGPSPAYQEQYGSRPRLSVLDPTTGSVVQLFEPFVNGTAVEREHSKWRWTKRPSSTGPVEVTDTFRERQVPFDPADSPPEESAGRVETLWHWAPRDA